MSKVTLLTDFQKQLLHLKPLNQINLKLKTIKDEWISSSIMD